MTTPTKTVTVRAPGLYGGVSRQPAHVRHPTQVEDSSNADFSVVYGLRKRNGTLYVCNATPTGGYDADADYRMHVISRDDTERYLVLYGEGDIWAFTASGTTVPIVVSAAAQTYLDLNSPTADELRFLTVADYTLILNTTVALGTSTSDAYTVSQEHEDFDEMIRVTPTADTYHRTRTDTPTRTKGFWKYDPGVGTFAKFSSRTVGSNWDAPTDYWNDDARNPAGFKITFRDNDNVTHAYNVEWDFYVNQPADMHDVAARITQAMQDAGAVDAICAWSPTAASDGKLVITGPYKGNDASITAIDANDNGSLYNMAANTEGQPFHLASGAVTLGSGYPGDDEMPLLDRWTRVPAPSQEAAKLDPATMPVKMVRISESYSQYLLRQEPFAYFRMGEASGTSAVNAAGGDSGTYINTPTLGVAGSLVSDPGTAVTFAAASSESMSVNIAGFGTAVNTGATFIARFKTTTATAMCLMGNETGSRDSNVNININTTDGSTNSEGRIYVEVIGLTIVPDPTAELIGYVNSNTGITDGEWHDLEVYVNAGSDTIRIWLDGVEKTVVYSSQDTPSLGTFSEFRVGCKGSASPSDFFNGTIHEVAFLTGLMTSDQRTNRLLRADYATIFEVDVIDWNFRETGDQYSNPAPSLWTNGRTASDITLHRNRLVLAGDENVVFSQAGDLFNFFIADADNLVDSDPIDVALSADEVTLIDYVVPFRKSLAIFTRSGRQFELNAPDTLTPSTAAITPSTAYKTLSVRPRAMGNALYFASPRGDYATIHEYFYDDARVSNTAQDVTAHVQGYLPADIKTIAAATNNDRVFVLPADSSDIYVHDMYYSGNRKEQSAWSKYAFDANTRIVDIGIIDDELFLLVEGPHSGYVIEKMTLGDEAEQLGLGYAPRLDRRVVLSGTFDSEKNETTWTLPIADTTLSTIVLGSGFGADAGDALTATSVVSTTVTKSGDYDAGQVIVGRSFTMGVELSRPFVRDDGGFADVDALLAVKHFVIAHRETQHVAVKITSPNRSNVVRTFTPAEEEGQERIWVGGHSRNLKWFLESDSHKPCNISSVEWVCDYLPRID